MPVIQCCKVGRVKLFFLQLNRKAASAKVRSPGPEVSCKLIGCLPDVRPPLQQWEDIALASFGMILISEVADAPVIMGKRALALTARKLVRLLFRLLKHNRLYSRW